MQQARTCTNWWCLSPALRLASQCSVYLEKEATPISVCKHRLNQLSGASLDFANRQGSHDLIIPHWSTVTSHWGLSSCLRTRAETRWRLCPKPRPWYFKCQDKAPWSGVNAALSAVVSAVMQRPSRMALRVVPTRCLRGLPRGLLTSGQAESQFTLDFHRSLQVQFSVELTTNSGMQARTLQADIRPPQ